MFIRVAPNFMDQTTITEYDQYQVMLNDYASIVEKTNQQLSLWTNPYGLMVGLLTFIVAVMAIVVAVYTWKNSKEQKELSRKIFREYQKKLDVHEQEMTQRREEMEGMLKILEEHNNTAGKKNEKLQELIDKQRETLAQGSMTMGGFLKVGSQQAGSDVSPYIGITGTQTIYCAKCGKSFRVPRPQITLGAIDGKTHCPYCGAANILPFPW
jgi:DNA-directed RNA polymerase subunit RPC12/RpoP